MNTNELTQLGQLLPNQYQAHWPAIALLTGILTHLMHRYFACGGWYGVKSLFLTGKPISASTPEIKPASTDAQPKNEP